MVAISRTKCIFMNEKFHILIRISLKFLPKDLFGSQYWFGQWLGAEQATSHFLKQSWSGSLTHICSTCGDELHDNVIKWKHFLRYWPFVRGIHRSPVNSPHKGKWRGVLILSLICAWINGWVNNREAGDLRRHSAHYDVIAMKQDILVQFAVIILCFIHSPVFDCYIKCHFYTHLSY